MYRNIFPTQNETYVIITINLCIKQVVSNYLSMFVCVCVCLWESEVEEMENIIYQVSLREKQE